MVTRLEFTADSRRLVSVSGDMNGLVWDVTPAALSKPMENVSERGWDALIKPE